MWYLIVAGVVLGILLIVYVVTFIMKERKKKNKDAKPAKIKKEKHKKVKKIKTEQEPEKLDTKGSYVDVVDKFLYRKEMKILILVNRALPKGYLVFPRIGLDTILEPVGSKTLYNSVCGKYVDMVIFEQETMKPKVAIDIYDDTIGDEQLDVQSPEATEALKSANLPLISFRVKADYTPKEIQEPIMKALGLQLPEEELQEKL